MDRKQIKPVWILGPLAILLAVGLKIYLIGRGVLPFNSDEAIVALMARHIRSGEMPVFFYGQAYMGSLDAFLVSLGFSIVGEKIVVIRIVQAILYCLFLITLSYLGKFIFGTWKHGWVAVMLMAIPAVNITLYTTVSLGGYGEALVIGNLLLILAIKIAANMRSDRFPWLLLLVWGFLAGFGVWVFGLTLVYSIPAGIYILWTAFYYRKKQRASLLGRLMPVVVTGGVLGAFPIWIFAIDQGFSVLLHELTGGAIASAESAPIMLRIGTRLLSLVLFGSTAAFGMRPPWEIRWLALPLIPFILAFWIGVVVYSFRLGKNYPDRKREIWLLTGVVLTLAFGFVFSSFGGDPSGRYFIPLSIPLSLFAAAMIIDLAQKYSKWVCGLVILVLVYNLWGTLESANRFPPGLTTQFDPIAQVDHSSMDELIAFLHENGETRGYTNYWVAYPLAFRSNEELIFIPRLPYHEDFRYTSRDDRYSLYTEIVNGSDQVAYITTHHPALDEKIRDGLSAQGIGWKEITISDYHVFYELGLPADPFELEIVEDYYSK